VRSSIGALVLLLILNGIADTVPAASWVGVVSPFHWMEQTSSAAPGGAFDLAATIGLAVAAAALVGGTIAVFSRRDIGSGLIAWRARAGAPVRSPSRNIMLRLPFSEGLWEQRVGLIAWVVSTMVLGALMVSVTKSVTDALVADPAIAAVFQHAAPGPLYVAILGLLWFGIALLLLAGYAVVQVSRWAAQDQEGRVEMLLSAPISRTQVVVERALEFAAASLLIVIAGYVGVAAAAPGSGLNLDAGHLLDPEEGHGHPGLSSDGRHADLDQRVGALLRLDRHLAVRGQLHLARSGYDREAEEGRARPELQLDRGAFDLAEGRSRILEDLGRVCRRPSPE